MIEDKATEKLKKRLKDMGLIVNMGAGRAKPPIGTGKHSTEKKSTSNDAAAGKNSKKK
jgi:hypothetical protein